MLIGKLLLVLSTSSLAVGATSWIVPGAVWKDTKGQKIDAHGGGIVKQGNTFYWVGQSASTGNHTSLVISHAEGRILADIYRLR